MIKAFNHFFHQFNCFTAHKYLWRLIAFLSLFFYLLPLFLYGPELNFIIFDNLDSSVVWNKILAQSNLIWAPNDTVIPNMMNGLPRFSYGSEFKILLWLYYFFSPNTAYIINEFLIHITAFISMFLLANRYIIPSHLKNRHVIVYFLSTVFALLPFWPPGGLTIPALPLVTYAFLEILYKKDRMYHWLILCIIPFYSSLILLYIFFIAFLSIFFIVYTLYTKKIHYKFAFAIVLFTLMYAFVEYRLIDTMLLHHTVFVSHRTEFNIFFTENLLESTRRFYLFFLNGHMDHLRGMQMPFLLPVILFATLLLLFNRRLSANETWVLFILFAISIWSGFWDIALGSIYSIPLILLYAVSYMVIKKKFDALLLSLIVYIMVSSFYGYTFYNGFSRIIDVFPLFKSFSLARAAFIQPLIFSITLGIAFVVIFRKMHFQYLFTLFILSLQLYALYSVKTFKVSQTPGFASFKDYYAVPQITKLKQDINLQMPKERFISYGMEPAIALYNGLYTVDGYSTNYPLSYKHAFQAVNEYQLQRDPNIFDWKEKIYTADKIFDLWGSKLYILTIESSMAQYKRDMMVFELNFNEDALRSLGVKYFLSAYELYQAEKKGLKFVKKYKGGPNSWDIYLYELSLQEEGL